jgi:hypothetical protein
VLVFKVVRPVPVATSVGIGQDAIHIERERQHRRSLTASRIRSDMVTDVDHPCAMPVVPGDSRVAGEAVSIG